MNRRACTLGLGMLLLAATTVAAEGPSKWEFELFPYAWVPGIFGTVKLNGRTATIDTTVNDMLQLVFDGVALAGGGYVSASYDRWTAFIDAFGGTGRDDTEQEIPTRFCTLCVASKAKLYFAFVDVGVGYRLGRWSLPERQRPVTLGIYAGTRITYFKADLSGSAGVLGGFFRSADISRSFEWADPLLGVRWEVPILDQLSLDFRADIGGFGASSELIWGVVSGVRYWLTWQPWSLQPWLGAGYRVMAFDRVGLPDSLDLQFRGPYIGVGMLF